MIPLKSLTLGFFVAVTTPGFSIYSPGLRVRIARRVLCDGSLSGAGVDRRCEPSGRGARDAVDRAAVASGLLPVGLLLRGALLLPDGLRGRRRRPAQVHGRADERARG